MDIGFVALNIVKQIIFFVFNLYVLTYISVWFAGGKYDDAFLPDFLLIPFILIKKWTIEFITELFQFLIHFVTGNIVYRSIKFEILCLSFKDKIVKYPKIEYDKPYPNMIRYYSPLTWIGDYLGNAIAFLGPLSLAIVAFGFLSPNSFSSVAESLKGWTEFSSGTPNLEFFSEMLNTFLDIVWNKFIIGTAQENVLLLIAIIFIFLFCTSGAYLHLEMEEGRKYVLLFGFFNSLLIIAFNIGYAMIDYSGYVSLASLINNAGIILLFVLIFGEIIEMLQFSTRKFISFISKR